MGALLLLAAVLGLTAVSAAPDAGRGIGLWPVGLAAGALVVAGRRWTLPLLGLVAVIAVGTIGLGGRPWTVAGGFGLGIALEVGLVWLLLVGRRGHVVGLRTGEQLNRFLLATATGALASAAVGALVSVLVGWGSAPTVALTLASAQWASLLTLVPWFSRLHDHPATAGGVERGLQWLLTLTVTPVVFGPTDFPSVVFLVIPLLAWGALRLTARQAMGQMVAVLAFSVLMTAAGNGPFTDAARLFDLPVDARGLLLAAYAVTCALIVIPLVVRAGEQIDAARVAASERDRLRNIVDSATGVAIIGTDEHGRVTLFNPGAERLLGYRAGEVLGALASIFHTDEEVGEQARGLGVRHDFVEVALALTEPANAHREVVFTGKRGEQRTHSMTLCRVLDDRGHVTGYVSTSEDVTEQVLARRALEEALATERHAVERLRDVDQVKDAFVSSVSHELRTPITSIVGYLEMLRDGLFGDLNDGQADAVQRVAANSDRLLGLIDDLLTLSRVQDEKLTPDDRAFDLRDAVRAGHDVVAPAWAHRDLVVSLDLPEEPVPFVGNRDMVERVVVNLVGNAAKFTPDGGRVGVRLVRGAGVATLEVSDTGLGIPREEQGRLFSRFFRSSVAQQQAIPGSGLGLSIAKAVVEQHDGTIRVESDLGRGTTFRVELPVAL